MAEKKDISQNKRLHLSSTNISNFLPSNIVVEIEEYEKKSLKSPNSTKNFHRLDIFKKNEKKKEEDLEIIKESKGNKIEESKPIEKNVIEKETLSSNIQLNNPKINLSLLRRNLNYNIIPLNSMANYQNYSNQNYYNINQYSNSQFQPNNMFNIYNPYYFNRYQYFQNQMNNPLLFTNMPPSNNFQYNNYDYSLKKNKKIVPQKLNQVTSDNNNNKEINQFHPLNDSQIDVIFSQVQKQNFSNQLNFLLESVNDKVFFQILKTHKGSRQLQKIITNNTPLKKEIDKIVNIINIDIKDIFCDYYGNYFLQKFFHFCSLEQRLFIYKNIKSNFLQISNDICGNHSLQCLIQLQNSKEEKELIKECINNNLYNLSLGSNSSHVIQKIISVIKEDDREYINNFMISNLMDLCLDANGICIVKEFINKTKNPFYILSIVSIFEIDINKLTYNQFGNFGIQEAIKMFGENYCGKIINKLIEHIIAFSISKFSSNVVDFLIDYLSKNNFIKFCEILSKMFLNDENLNILLKNKFANYVLENSLSIVINIDNSIIENMTPVNKDEFNNFIILRQNIYKSLKKNSIIKKKKKIMKLLKDNV
jgi:hypothetical protein